MKIYRHLVSLIIILTFSAISIYSQVIPVKLASLERKSEFSESFEGNTSLWITDNQYLTGTILNGYYTVKCKNYNNQTGLSYVPVEIDQSRDFEIETLIKVVKGSGGLVFGMDDKFNHYRVEFTDKSELFVAKSTSRIDKMFSGTKNPNIKPGAFNKITVSKLDNVFYVSINDVLIKEFDNIRLDGNRIGFNVGLNSEIMVDNLKISYLQQKTLPVTASNDVISKTNAPAPNKPDPVQPGPISDEPVITWTSPSAERVQHDLYTARVTAKVKSNTQLTSVVFYVNGTPRGEAERRPVTGEPDNFIIEKSLNLNPGENTIFFLATNEKNSTKRSDNRYFVLPEAVKPVIKWGNPLNTNVSVTSELLTVDACINSPSGLKSVKILVNGESQGVDNVFTLTQNGECNIRWQKSVILKEGTDNSLYIIAENAAGDVTSENRIVRYSKAIAEKRIALVIGNSNYGTRPPLKNPVNDANLMEGTLKSLGFTVIKKLNLDLDSMENTIRDFSRKISDYNVALFYYAGHGVQVDNNNYLIPVDAKLEKKEDCKWETFAVNDLLEEFNRQPDKINIAIFDACRSNPFPSWSRGSEGAFMPLTNTTGTFVSFATAPGATAADGESGNGLFTEELVKQMDIVQPIESVFTNTRIKVYDRSKKSQRPQVWNDLNGEFYFKKQ